MKVVAEPIVPRQDHALKLERALVAYLDETVFDPLRNILSAARLNAGHEKKDHSVIWAALIAGTIWYADEVFTGKFNAAISGELRALGAVRRGDAFALAVEQMPFALRGALAASAARSAALHTEVLQTLDLIVEHLEPAPTGIGLSDFVDTAAQDLQEQLVKSVSHVEGMPTPTPVPEGLKTELQHRAEVGADKAIKNFSLEATQRLRARVKQNIADGSRTDRLADLIEAEFGVGQRKARFIADQETSLLVSKFREDRYRSLGSTQYRWETSHDERVRPTAGGSNNHRVLDGRIFSWDEPPIVDPATARRCHPGEDWSCRCCARPVFNVAA